MKDSILKEKCDIFAHLIYKNTKNFPKEEIYGLTSQLRRFALSVPLNIIEGFARQRRKDHLRFLEISYGSLKETKYLLYFAYREEYLNENKYQELINLADEIGKLLWSTMKTLRNKI